MAIIAATDSTIDQLISTSKVPVLVDLWAEWCGPCKAMDPVLAKIDVDQSDKVQVVKYDIEKSGEFASRVGTRSIPLLILFNNGTEVGRSVGVKSERQLLDWVSELV